MKIVHCAYFKTLRLRGWLRYHDIFNETITAKYVVSLLDGSFNPDDYPFPTLLQQ